MTTDEQKTPKLDIDWDLARRHVESRVSSQLYDPSGVKHDLPEDAWAVFRHRAEAAGLDPLMDQILILARWVTGENRHRFTTFVEIAGLRMLADRTGRLAGSESQIFVNPDGTIQGARACVKAVLPTGNLGEFHSEVYFSEYNTGKSTWAQKPATMICKVAESHALRKAFPSSMASLYIPEELDMLQERADAATPSVHDVLDEFDGTVVKTEAESPPAGSGGHRPINAPDAAKKFDPEHADKVCQKLLWAKLKQQYPSIDWPKDDFYSLYNGILSRCTESGNISTANDCSEVYTFLQSNINEWDLNGLMGKAV